MRGQEADRVRLIRGAGSADTPGMGSEQKRLQVILWIAFLLGVVCYPTALTLIVQHGRPTPDADLLASLQLPCIGLASAQTLGAYWFFLRGGGAAPPASHDPRALWSYAAAWAVSEAIGLHGLLLGLLGAEAEISTLFFTWAIALLLILRPPAAREGVVDAAQSNAPRT
jgi:hypothetical protein